jgi:hypothetical protein
MGVAKFPALFALGVFYYDEMRMPHAKISGLR